MMMEPIKKNESYTLTIGDLTAEGAGVGRIDGFTMFVPYALPGETVRARAVKVQKNYAFGRLETVELPSPSRATPPCPHFGRCGGCSWQHLEYAAQLEQKQKLVRNCLERIGGVENPPVAPCLGMETPFRYRNKGQFPVGGAPGSLVAGFFAPRSHRLVPVEDCLLQRPESNQAVGTVLEFLNRYRIPAYDEATGKGLVRHILTRLGFATGEMMVCLVINGSRIPHEKELAQALAKLPGLKSLVLNENTARTNVILGRRTRVLWGEDAIHEELDGIRYRVSPLSFFQVNPVQAARLYRTAVDFLAPKPSDTVLDLYCGTGSLSLFLAQKAGKVIGVEVVPEAVEDARRNAVDNGLHNTEFYAGEVERLLPGLFAQGYFQADGVVLDPPRKGCDPSVLKALLELQAPRLVYVSCDPATLARDVKVLQSGGYRLEIARPVDQFCQTGHVETVCLMSRVKD